MNAAARRQRNAEMVSTVAMYSWPDTAEAIDVLLRAALHQARQQMSAAAASQPQRLAATAA
jgi:hypothetical protein